MTSRENPSPTTADTPNNLRCRSTHDPRGDVKPHKYITYTILYDLLNSHAATTQESTSACDAASYDTHWDSIADSKRPTRTCIRRPRGCDREHTRAATARALGERAASFSLPPYMKKAHAQERSSAEERGPSTRSTGLAPLQRITTHGTLHQSTICYSYARATRKIPTYA